MVFLLSHLYLLTLYNIYHFSNYLLPSHFLNHKYYPLIYLELLVKLNSNLLQRNSYLICNYVNKIVVGEKIQPLLQKHNLQYIPHLPNRNTNLAYLVFLHLIFVLGPPATLTIKIGTRHLRNDIPFPAQFQNFLLPSKNCK